jgi:hypothetical protein
LWCSCTKKGAADRAVIIGAPGEGHSGADQSCEEKTSLNGVEHPVDRRVGLNKAMNLSGGERNLDVINESEVRLN